MGRQNTHPRPPMPVKLPCPPLVCCACPPTAMEGLHRAPRSARTVPAAGLSPAHPLAATLSASSTAAPASAHSQASSGTVSSIGHAHARPAPSPGFGTAAAAPVPGMAASDVKAVLSTMQRLEAKVDSMGGELAELRSENAAMREAIMGLAVLEPLAARVEALTGLVKTLADGGLRSQAGGAQALPALPSGAPAEAPHDGPAPGTSKGKLKIWVGSWNVGAEVRAEIACMTRDAAPPRHPPPRAGPLRRAGGAEPRRPTPHAGHHGADGVLCP